MQKGARTAIPQCMTRRCRAQDRITGGFSDHSLIGNTVMYRSFATVASCLALLCAIGSAGSLELQCRGFDSNEYATAVSAGQAYTLLADKQHSINATFIDTGEVSTGRPVSGGGQTSQAATSALSFHLTHPESSARPSQNVSSIFVAALSNGSIGARMVVDGRSSNFQAPIQIGSLSLAHCSLQELQLQQLPSPPTALRIMTPLLTVYISGIPASTPGQTSGTLHVRVVADMRMLATSKEHFIGLLSPTINILFPSSQAGALPSEGGLGNEGAFSAHNHPHGLSVWLRGQAASLHRRQMMSRRGLTQFFQAATANGNYGTKNDQTELGEISHEFGKPQFPPLQQEVNLESDPKSHGTFQSMLRWSPSIRGFWQNHHAGKAGEEAIKWRDANRQSEQPLPHSAVHVQPSTYEPELSKLEAASTDTPRLQLTAKDRLSNLPGLEGTVYAELPLSAGASLAVSLDSLRSGAQEPPANDAQKNTDGHFVSQAAQLQLDPARANYWQQNKGSTDGHTGIDNGANSFDKTDSASAETEAVKAWFTSQEVVQTPVLKISNAATAGNEGALERQGEGLSHEPRQQIEAPAPAPSTRTESDDTTSQPGSQKSGAGQRSLPDPYGLWELEAQAPDQKYADDADFKAYGQLHGQLFDPYD